jgi:hypothetical protein
MEENPRPYAGGNQRAPHIPRVHSARKLLDFDAADPLQKIGMRHLPQ